MVYLCNGQRGYRVDCVRWNDGSLTVSYDKLIAFRSSNDSYATYLLEVIFLKVMGEEE